VFIFPLVLKGDLLVQLSDITDKNHSLAKGKAVST
jgi:hypothetical protein